AQCAIEIQRALSKRNHDVAAERRIKVRIGIHIGDVVHRGGDVYGDGVNIASRIEPLANAGGICVSNTLTVKSHQSALKFKNSNKSMPEIGQELNADAIVEGSVLPEGNQITVNVQLIDARTDRHLWAKKFERDVANIFKMRNEVAEAIAHEIQAALSPEQSSRLSSAGAVNPAALQEYLLGRQSWNRLTEKANEDALEHFNRATKIDPTFALAWAGLSDVYWISADTTVAPAEARAMAKAAAQRAL